MVTGGDKQCSTINKVKASSPTAALESILMMSVIDAFEGHDVATINLPNAFIQMCLEDDEDKIILHVHGKLAELLVMVEPEIYSKYVTINSKGEKVLYVRALNAIYGMM